MPRISLKPNSAEYQDGKAAADVQCCDMPGCAAQGDYKAPKHRGLNEYYRFCLDHVREYNSAWNFFEGMSGREIEEHMLRSLYGDRPTWRYDMEGMAEDNLRRKAWQTYNFTEEQPKHQNGPHPQGNTPEFEALALMELAPPVTLEEIKIQYKKLAKKYHPDNNQGCKKSEELLKSINMAYTILKVAYQKYENLPSSSSR